MDLIKKYGVKKLAAITYKDKQDRAARRKKELDRCIRDIKTSKTDRLNKNVGMF